MNRAMRTAASGMLAQQMLVDSIANNIANANTTSFKKNRLSFRSLLYRTMREPGAPTNGRQTNPTGLQIGSGTEVSSSAKIFAQGDLELSSSEFDLAIQGDGFFKVMLANGDVRYTRDGSFRLDGEGNLVTVDGLQLDPPIDFSSDVTQVVVSQDGQVFVEVQGDPTMRGNGAISLTRFANPAGLKAIGDNLYAATESAGAPQELTPGEDGAGILRQSFRERSNVAVVEELIELIQAQRNYEVNSRTIRVSDEMLQLVGNLIQ